MAHIWDQLALQIKDWGRELGFNQIGIAKGKMEVDKSTGEMKFTPGGLKWCLCRSSQKRSGHSQDP